MTDSIRISGEHFVGNRLSLPRWTLLLIVIVLSPGYYFFFRWIDNPVTPSPELALYPDEYVLSDAALPPESGWTSSASYAEEVSGRSYFNPWLRFNVNLDEMNEDQLGIFIPGYFSNFSIVVDGNQLFRTAPIARPYYINNEPRLIPVSRSQLVAANGIIHVKAVGETTDTGPFLMYVGSFNGLSEAHESWASLHILMPRLSLTILGMVSVAMVALFVMAPSHTFYGWYALTSVLYVAHAMHALVAQPPYNTLWWLVTGRLALFLTVTAIFFYHRYFGLRIRWAEYGISGVMGVAALFLISTAILQDYQAYQVQLSLFTLAAFATTFYTFPFLLWAMLKFRNIESLALAICMANAFVISIRDVQFQLVGGDGTLYHLQFSAALNALVFGALLVRRFVDSMREAEALNAHLESRIHDKSVELEASYAQLTAEERRRALAEERTRIMRDMHDGLGGQLVHAMALTDKGQDHAEIRNALQFAIDDLRLIIDSLAPEENTVDHVIASFRHRATRHIEQTGMQVEWDIGDDLGIELAPKQALALLRLLQEAITNSIRHAHAELLKIAASITQDRELQIVIEDNGKGIPETATPGRGLNNMRVRAREIGGRLDIDSSATGTVITCLVPAPAA